MAQHDYTIANQGFPAFRSDLNDALAAIVSNNSGATEPTTMFAHQMWVDTAANPSVLKIRNADNDAWITIGSIDQTGDTFTLVNLRTSGPVVFNDAGADVDFRVEGDTEANLLFVDASTDRVGIGTNSPDSLTTLSASSGNTILELNRDDANANGAVGAINFTASDGHSVSSIYAQADGDNEGAHLVFRTTSAAGQNDPYGANTYERIRITAGGDLLVGTTVANTSDNSNGAYFTNGILVMRQEASQCAIFRRWSTNGIIVRFRNALNNEIGNITTSASATAYNTSSDYRLKENVAPMTGALAKVLELNPVTYTWKTDGSAGEGFIAHELQAICPDAVSGEKDGEEMQGVDYGKITPLLTAALQEAITEIQSLKVRVAELEAK